MNASLLGLFSGFPTHHFPDAVAQVLRAYLPRQESLVFISAWPEEYMAFADHRVIDRRTSAADAVRLAREADCIFLMGGDITLQMALICDLGLVPELRASRAVLLGVSAGAMNMGRYAADVWETKALCEGIGLTGIVMKGHYAEDAWFIPIHPIVAMEDESAIFVQGNTAWKLGKIHWIDKGGTTIFTDETLKTIGNTL